MYPDENIYKIAYFLRCYARQRHEISSPTDSVNYPLTERVLPRKIEFSANWNETESKRHEISCLTHVKTCLKSK